MAASVPGSHHCSLPSCHRMNMLPDNDDDSVPSDEEAQDLSKKVLFLATHASPSRRRSRSLVRLHPPPTLTPTLSLSGYESEPSDLSLESCEDNIVVISGYKHHSQQDDESSNTSTCRRRRHRWTRQWPIRLLLITCVYLAWTMDSDSLFVEKRNIPKAAFSSQHGREVPIQPMEQHSPLLLRPAAKKRRPQVAHALPSKHDPPVLGHLERFVMDETFSSPPKTKTTRRHSLSRWQYFGFIALAVLAVETGIREVRRRCMPRQERYRRSE